MSYSVRVWDAPTRLFHWGLVLCIVGLVTTAQIGGAAMQWHFRLGYSVLCLLLFRLVWGFVGGHWSRFQAFLFGPRQMLDYLRGRSDPMLGVGHNPLGSLSVFAMLLLLALQVTTGLMSDDEIAAAGPLASHVASQWVGYATFYHKSVGKLAILVLVLTHLAAITFYTVKKRDKLVKAMLTGDKDLPFSAPSAVDSGKRRALALAVLLAWIGVVNLLLVWLDA